MTNAAGMAAADYYAVLGVTPSAETEVIDAAYRAMARKYHPDVNRDADASDRTRVLNEAHRVLHDPAARAEYDRVRGPHPATVSAGPVATGARPERRADREIDLFGAALGDTWRRAVAARRRAAAARQAQVRSGAQSETATRRASLAVPLAALGSGIVMGALVRPLLVTGDVRSLHDYWRAASGARATIEGLRLRYAASPGVADGVNGWVAVVGNTAFGPLATQFIAELENAGTRLRAAGRIPSAAESYHFLQLEDWHQERDVRITQRDAVVSRNAELWDAGIQRETTWRSTAQHQRTETAAWQLAALVTV
jgi:hypothetical protein